MKIRNGFVTNSSSSSYLVMTVRNRELVEVIRELTEKELRENYICIVIEDDETIRYEEECSSIERIFDLDGVINQIAYVISPRIEDTDYDCANGNALDKVAHKIVENKDKLVESTELVEVIESHYGYGGEDDSRYEKSHYTPEQLNDIYNEIAQKKSILADDVSDEDFSEYVASKSSSSHYTYTFDREQGIEETTESFELE